MFGPNTNFWSYFYGYRSYKWWTARLQIAFYARGIKHCKRYSAMQSRGKIIKMPNQSWVRLPARYFIMLLNYFISLVRERRAKIKTRDKKWRLSPWSDQSSSTNSIQVKGIFFCLSPWAHLISQRNWEIEAFRVLHRKLISFKNIPVAIGRGKRLEVCDATTLSTFDNHHGW